MSKNENPISIEDIENEIDAEDFEFFDNFTYACDLIPDKKNERLLISNEKTYNGKLLTNISGLVYLMVVDGKIIKIGSTTNTFRQRVMSYNTGKKDYVGKNSTTNYFVLHSLINIGKLVKIYVYFPSPIETKIMTGEKVGISPGVAKIEEHKLILYFEKEFGHKPILCTQA